MVKRDGAARFHNLEGYRANSKFHLSKSLETNENISPAEFESGLTSYALPPFLGPSVFSRSVHQIRSYSIV